MMSFESQIFVFIYPFLAIAFWEFVKWAYGIGRNVND